MKKILYITVYVFASGIMFAQDSSLYTIDSIYSVVVNCYINGDVEPTTYTLLLPTKSKTEIDFSCFNNFEKSLQNNTYNISPFPFSLVDMARISFADSSSYYQNSIYNDNLLKWITYNKTNSYSYECTIHDCHYILSIALIIGKIIQSSGSKYPFSIATIDEFIPMPIEIVDKIRMVGLDGKLSPVPMKKE
jgi:hypothetical protein